MFDRILAATENPTFCDEKVRTAAALAGERGATLTVLHVLPSADPIYRDRVIDFRTGQEMVADDAYRRRVAKEIEKHCGPFIAPGTVAVATGAPPEEIARTVRHGRFDLVVVGPPRVSDGARTAAAVLRRAPCPVMLVNAPLPRKTPVVADILVAWADSRSGAPALRWAARLASDTGAAIHVLHVRPPPAGDPRRKPPASDTESRREALAAACRGVTGGLKAEYVVAAGESPGTTIAAAASEREVDLVVMGRRTRPRTEDRNDPGGTVSAVAAHAPCPVVMVTAPPG